MASINWLRKVVSGANGRHNAFTDLVKWGGRYFLTFRNGTRHGSMDGRIFILRSEDLARWEHEAVISTSGDDRDPKFLITDEELFLFFPSRSSQSPRRGRTLVSSSADGRKWSQPRQSFLDNYTFWRPKEFEGHFFVAAYYYGGDSPEKRRVELLQSEDALRWKRVSTIYQGDGASETALLFFPDGCVFAVVRRRDMAAALAKSKSPFEAWEISDLNAHLHGPAIIEMRGKIYAAGRKFLKGGETKTALYLSRDKHLKEILTLPSGGDTSYPGILPKGEDEILISYYSSHQGPSSIYLASVKVRF